MLTSDNFTQDMLSNPLKLTNAVIDMLQSTDTGGTISINDPNNGFIMQLFANTSIFAKFSEKIDYVNSFFYSKRARTADQLFGHLSEFDYVKLTAGPAKVPFLFAMLKQWIIDNAVPFDANYNKIQIPATSKITVGDHVFSMYYPIDIFVNKNTDAVTAFYNTDVDNNLYPLESNVLLDVRDYTQNGLDYFVIQFDMFQFDRLSTGPVTIGQEQGFVKTFNFNDQFYAVKAFNYLSDGSWYELDYSLSKKYYDYKKPTALISFDNDVKTVKVEIPQIYFDNNQLSKTIKIELYTTKGSVNYSFAIDEIRAAEAFFDPSSSIYAAPLDKMPSWNLYPTVSEVIGGSDALTFDQMRSIVTSNSIYTGVPITNAQLMEAANKAGFDSMTRVIDDLTDRLYSVSSIIKDDSGIIIPTFTGSLLIESQDLADDYSTIIKYPDGYNTILPTTLFKITDNPSIVNPLSDGEVNHLKSLTKEQLLAEYNTGNYVRQPFHITLLTTAKSPAAKIYNLLSPSIDSISFIRENPHSAPQMSAVAAGISHQNSGTGGYVIQFSITRSTNIANVSTDNFKIFLTGKSKIGEDIYIPATFVRTDNLGNDVWQINLATNYKITTDNHLTVAMYNANDVLSFVEISLSQTFNLISAFVTSFEPTIIIDSALNSLLPTSFINNHTAMSQQKIAITFGSDLSDEIYCGVDTTWGSDVYATADQTIYYTAYAPIFQMNEQHVIETYVDPDTKKVSTAIIYNTGDTPSIETNITAKTTIDLNPTSSNAVLTLDDVTGLLVGMQVMGLNITVGSKITTINDKTVTLDHPILAAIPHDTVITFVNEKKSLRTTIAQTEISPIVNLVDTSHLLVGQSCFGIGIDTNTKIQSIDSPTQITLSKNPTVILPNNRLLTFINTTAKGVVKILKGSVLSDPTGKPIVVTAAKNRYSIPTLLFDNRLFVSDNPNDVTIVNGISKKLQSYANQISAIGKDVLEVSDVFFKPSRSMGTALFGIGNGKTRKIPLQFSFNITVYVNLAVYNTPTLLDTMSNTIYGLVNEEIQKPTISVSELGSYILSKLDASAVAVEVDGINNDASLKLIALQEADAIPCIEYKLVALSDGTIDRVPNITINYVTNPDPSKTVILNNL